MVNSIPFGYDEGAADRIKEHVDRIAEQHSKEMFSKKQLLDLLDEIEDGFLHESDLDTKFTQVDFVNAIDRIRQRLLKNEL
jgi:hypothetical protein|tara:strand:- start:373 stop:615 length:243 start_codon:yes stop_codon:yes gene_type:complete